MQFLSASVSELRPLQWGVRESSIYNLLRYFNPTHFDPIPVMSHTEGLVLGGGHNRSFFIYLANQAYNADLKVPVVLVESDHEVGVYFEGLFRALTLEELRQHYVSRRNNDPRFPRSIGEMKYNITWDDMSKYLKPEGDMVYSYDSLKGKKEFVGRLPPRERFTFQDYSGSYQDVHILSGTAS